MDPAYQGQPIPPPGEAGQVIMQGPQLEGAELSHPAESYLPHESHTFGAPWTGAVDQTDYNTEGAHLYDQLPAAEGNHAGPSHEGAPAVEMGTSATPAGDDKKKKKKEKAEKVYSKTCRKWPLKKKTKNWFSRPIIAYFLQYKDGQFPMLQLSINNYSKFSKFKTLFPLCSQPMYQMFEILKHSLYRVKPALSSHTKQRPKIGFQDRLLLNAGQKYCRMLQESILQYFQPSLSYHLS